MSSTSPLIAFGAVLLAVACGCSSARPIAVERHDVHVAVLGAVAGRPDEPPRPLAGARVRVLVAEVLDGESRTDAEGSAVARVPAGGENVTVVADAPGFLADRTAVSAPPQARIEFALSRSGALHGRVVEWDGGPALSGVTVEATPPVEEGVGADAPAYDRTTTDLHGEFRLTGVPEGGGVMVTARALGFTGVPVETLVPAGADSGATIELVRTQPVVVLVRDIDGAPAIGARVRIRVTQAPEHLPTALQGLTFGETVVVTDAHGMARARLAADWTHELVAEAAGAAPSAVARGVVLERERMPEPLTSTLRRPHRLRIEVPPRGDGTPDRRTVRLDEDAWWEFRAGPVGPDGVVTFDAIPAGRIRVELRDGAEVLASETIDVPDVPATTFRLTERR